MPYSEILFEIQPIRPLVRAGARFDRLPWYEVLLRPLGREPDDLVTEVYARGEQYPFEMAVLDRALARMWSTCSYSVNISVSTLGVGRFAAEFLGLLVRHQVRPQQLVIEIVGRECASAGDWTGARDSIARLTKVVDLAFALDDVGENDSLRFCCPVRYVKLAKSMTEYLLRFPAAPRILLEVVAMCGPKVQIVAEGVETLDQLKVLSALTPAIQYWQGFHENGVPVAMPEGRQVPKPMLVGAAA